MLLQLINEQYLIGILASQAIRRMNVELLKAAHVSRIAQSFQCRSVKRRTANAVIKETVCVMQRHSILIDLPAKVSHLRSDRLFLSLSVGRDARIDGRDGVECVLRCHTARSCRSGFVDAHLGSTPPHDRPSLTRPTAPTIAASTGSSALR